MSALQVALLLAYAFGMSAGQILFKIAALSIASPDGAATSIADRLLHLGLSPFFLSALAMYFALSVLWVWILTFTPLSRAYPFVALAIVATPVVSHFAFAEALDLKFYFGLFFIVVGLILVIK